jgi:hypothetical protein
MAKGRVKCGPAEAFVFIAALVCGTGCSLTSKLLLGIEAVGQDGEPATFSKPIFQTFAMFVAMLAALPFHWAVTYFKIPFPGYTHKSGKPASQSEAPAVPLKVPKAGYNSFQEENVEAEDTGLSREMYLLLMFPAIFDLTATALCMFGLQYINVSSYQLLRGSSIVFVALMKNFWIGDRLKKFMWIGVVWNLISIILVGATTFLEAGGADVGPEDVPSRPLLGVALILAGALVQSLQYAFEEQAMSGASVSPMLLVGMEGFWGGLICAFIIYPTVYLLPGTDVGSFEDPFNTFYMIQNNTHLQWIIAVYIFFIFFYNLMCVILTCMLDSVWHAILDNFRPVTVWGLDLMIFYLINANYGEVWTNWSYLQLVAMGCLLYGTGLYNAPNPGSIQLLGRPTDCFIDCTKEYQEVTAEQQGGAPLISSPYISPLQSGAGRRAAEVPKELERRGVSSRARTEYRRSSE